MIFLKNINCGYEQNGSYIPILKDLSFKIEQGDWVTIIGQSGSGKTTFLNCLTGLVRPKSGQVLYDEVDIFQLKSDEMSLFRRDNIGLVFQDFKLIPYYTAVENVMIPLVHKVEKKKLKERAKEVMTQVGLRDKTSSIPSQLSGGEKQRVAIARALVADPKLIVCDEPTGNLDINIRDTIVKVLLDLKELGHTIILVTHDLQITNYSDHIYKIVDGSLKKIEKEG